MACNPSRSNAIANVSVLSDKNFSALIKVVTINDDFNMKASADVIGNAGSFSVI